MATENALMTISAPASGDLSSGQYRFVKLNTSGEAVIAGDGEKAIGVLQNKPDAQGKAAQIGTGGVTKVRFGASVEENVGVGSNGDGDAVTAATGDFILGTVTTGAGSGEIGSVLFQPQGAAA